MKWLNISLIEKWWLRFAALLFLGIPVLSEWPLSNIEAAIQLFFPFELKSVGDISSVVSWIIYSCIVWLVVYSSVGVRKFLEYLAASFILGLTTAILGSVMRKAIPILSGSLSQAEISLKMVHLLLVIVTVVPYALLFVNSFSAKHLMTKLTGYKGKRRAVGLHLALLLRVIQHTGEVIFNLVEIWKEEHPDKILPRHRVEWGVKWSSRVNIFGWAWGAVIAWIFATMIHTFEPIPCMVDEVENINRYGR